MSTYVAKLKTDLCGVRFGRLTAIRFVGYKICGKKNNHKSLWECKCDCGNIKIVMRNDLKRENTKSCGCLKIDHNTKSFGTSNFNRLYRTYKQKAEQRGLIFNISEEKFRCLTKGMCYYCACLPKNIVNDKGSNGEYIYNGIDRINNSVGYELGNCVSCCTKCNRMKMKLSLEDFIEQVNKICDNFKKGK